MAVSDEPKFAVASDAVLETVVFASNTAPGVDIDFGAGVVDRPGGVALNVATELR